MNNAQVNKIGSLSLCRVLEIHYYQRNYFDFSGALRDNVDYSDFFFKIKSTIFLRYNNFYLLLVE